MRNILVMLEVDDNLAIEKDLGTIEYVEKEFKKLSDSGITLQNARILDADDEADEVAIEFANKILEENL